MRKLNTLFNPLKIGDLQIKNRIIMAAMTRMRTNPQDNIPNDLLVEYYSQRASAGLILTECAAVAQRSNAFPGAAGIFNNDQAQGWKRVVDAVHAKDGKIFLQIFHAGRASHSKYQNGLETWAPSPIAIRGKTYVGPHEVPHEMTDSEINLVIKEFYDGAIRAKDAGFDGVELHGANGYLVDQFLRTSSNQRKDKYGQSVENRVRFPLQVIDALVDVFGNKRVGIKISPIGRYNDMYDQNPVETFQYLLNKLSGKQIAFVEIMNNNDDSGYENFGYPASRDQIPDVYSVLRPHFNGVMIGNYDLTPQSAAEAIEKRQFDAASFGRLYIGNPDLVKRIDVNAEFVQPDFSKAYGGGADGYTTYANLAL